MNSNLEIIQPSETSFHIKSAKFICRPCNRQFSCINPENGRAACPRCENYSTEMLQNAQQAPIEVAQPSISQTNTQQSQPQPQRIQIIRQTIYRPGQTLVIETIQPEINQSAAQGNNGFGLGNLFGLGGLPNLFGGINQPLNQTRNPSDLFGNQQQTQQTSQGQQGIYVPLEFLLLSNPMMFYNAGDYERLIQEFLRNDPNNHGPAPASEQSINKLKEFEFASGICKNSECSVCQDDYKTGDKCVSLPCEHNYHKDCVVEWLKRHDSCPICRKPISTPSKQQASDRMEEEVPHQSQQAGF